MIIQHTESTSLNIHLERLVAPDGDPDVVPVEDLVLVQDDDSRRGGLLPTVAVSGGQLRVCAGRPGGARGEADGCPREAHQHTEAGDVAGMITSEY